MSMIELYKKIYPIGTKIAYHLPSSLCSRPCLGQIVGYKVTDYDTYGYEEIRFIVQDCEWSDMRFMVWREDIKKAYYTENAVMQDQKNRDFL